MNNTIKIERSNNYGDINPIWEPIDEINILDTCEYITIQNNPLESPACWYKLTSPCGVRYVGPRTNTATINIKRLIVPAPEGLAITQDTNLTKQLQLNWIYSGSPEEAEGCYVFRSTNDNLNFSLYATIPDTSTTSLFDVDVDYNNAYYYKVQYYSGSITSNTSSVEHNTVESIMVFSDYSTYLNNGLIDFGSNVGRALFFHNVGNVPVSILSATINGSQFTITQETLPQLLTTTNPTWETQINIGAINGSGVPDYGSLVVIISGSASHYLHSYVLNLTYFDPEINA